MSYCIDSWQEGRLAYMDGVPEDANPWDFFSSDGEQWTKGWKSAEEDYAENEGELQ